jgi:hypothetical protein
MTHRGGFYLVTPGKWLFTQHGRVAHAREEALKYYQAHQRLQGAEYKIEEFVRQWFLRELITTYRYPAAWIGTRIQVEEPVKIGSAYGKADIAIKRPDWRTSVYVETKRYGASNSKAEFTEAVRQLETYLAATHFATVGVVTDGMTTRAFRKMMNPNDFVEIDELPYYDLEIEQQFMAHFMVTHQEELRQTSRAFQIGSVYTRREIHARLGGSLETYLPTVGGRVVCGCFTSKLNPNVPYEILVGDAPIVVKGAEILARQETPIPVFLKMDKNCWEYLGFFRSRGYTTDANEVIPRAKAAGREYVAGMLYLERLNRTI